MQRKEIIESIGTIENSLMYLMQRLQSMEVVFEQYVTMQKNGKRFEGFLESQAEKQKNLEKKPKKSGESK